MEHIVNGDHAGENTTVVKNTVNDGSIGTMTPVLKEESGNVVEPGVKSEEDGDKVDSLIKGIYNLKLVGKPSKFVHSQDFNIFCERFLEYFRINNLSHPELYLTFLNNVDSRTYFKLNEVTLDTVEKQSAEHFIEKYRNYIYPREEKVSFQLQLNNIRQKASDSIDDFSYRISELASRAYTDGVSRERGSFMAFMQGVRDINLKIKLNEAGVSTYTKTVAYAKRLENVANTVANGRGELCSVLCHTRSRPEVRNKDCNVHFSGSESKSNRFRPSESVSPRRQGEERRFSVSGSSSQIEEQEPTSSNFNSPGRHGGRNFGGHGYQNRSRTSGGNIFKNKDQCISVGTFF